MRLHWLQNKLATEVFGVVDTDPATSLLARHGMLHAPSKRTPNTSHPKFVTEGNRAAAGDVVTVIADLCPGTPRGCAGDWKPNIVRSELRC